MVFKVQRYEVFCTYASFKQKKNTIFLYSCPGKLPKFIPAHPSNVFSAPFLFIRSFSAIRVGKVT